LLKYKFEVHLILIASVTITFGKNQGEVCFLSNKIYENRLGLRP